MQVHLELPGLSQTFEQKIETVNTEIKTQNFIFLGDSTPMS